MKENKMKLMTNLNKAIAWTNSLFFLVLIFLGCMLMKQQQNPFLLALYSLCTLCMIFSFLFYLKKIRTKSAILEVDDRGITDNSSSLAIGFVPWEDIKSIRITSFWSSRYIGLDLVREKDYYQKYSFLKRKIAELNKKLGLASVNIPLELTGEKVEKIYPQIIEIQNQWLCKREQTETRIDGKAKE